MYKVVTVEQHKESIKDILPPEQYYEMKMYNGMVIIELAIDHPIGLETLVKLAMHYNIALSQIFIEGTVLATRIIIYPK